jgi:secretion/DNA translocation related TadE-like protein
MVAVLLVVAAGGSCLGSAVIGRHRAQAAADLASIAAAARAPAGSRAACAYAAVVVRRMRANQIGCHVDGLDVVVTVEVPVDFAGWSQGTARATARAGPVGQG